MPPQYRRSSSSPMTVHDTKTRFAKANLDDQGTWSVEKYIVDDPITNKVPVEITSHIFQVYVQLHHKVGDLANQPTFGFDEIPVGAPLRLGAVCRRWREIAWDTPTLWTCLVADLLSKGHIHGPNLVKEWLMRTSELPVNVALRLHADAVLRHRTQPLVLKGQQRRDAVAIVEVICEYWPKLQSIDLRDVPWHLTTKLNSNVPSALKNLCIGGFGSDILDRRNGRRLFGQTSHKHRPIGFSLLSTIPPTLLNLDWSRLTTLDLDDVDRPVVFEVITLCAATLTKLTLKAISDDVDDVDFDEDWLPIRVVDLPALLAISFMELGSLEGFAETLFDYITAPALKSIRYFGMEKDNELPVDSIISFIEHSSCKILHFTLHEPSFTILDPDIDGDPYVSLLSAMPSLRVLDISFGADITVEPLFLALAERNPRTDRPTFLPHLKEFNCAAFPTFEWALFPEIWMATHPSGHRIGDEDFKFSEICLARAREKLAASLILRGPLDMEDLMDGEALLALAAIKAQSYAEIYVTTDIKGKTPLSLKGRKFLEESFLHSFPEEVYPGYSEILQTFKREGIFQ